MPSADFRRSAIYYVIVAGAVLLILVTLTLVEGWALIHVLPNFNFSVDARGHLIPNPPPDAPDMMTATGVTLVENILRIVKILLWMILVISTVRMVTNLVFRLILQN